MVPVLRFSFFVKCEILQKLPVQKTNGSSQKSHSMIFLKLLIIPTVYQIWVNASQSWRKFRQMKYHKCTRQRHAGVHFSVKKKHFYSPIAICQKLPTTTLKTYKAHLCLLFLAFVIKRTHVIEKKGAENDCRRSSAFWPYFPASSTVRKWPSFLLMSAFLGKMGRRHPNHLLLT